MFWRIFRFVFVLCLLILFSVFFLIAKGWGIERVMENPGSISLSSPEAVIQLDITQGVSKALFRSNGPPSPQRSPKMGYGSNGKPNPKPTTSDSTSTAAEPKRESTFGLLRG